MRSLIELEANALLGLQKGLTLLLLFSLCVISFRGKWSLLLELSLNFKSPTQTYQSSIGYLECTRLFEEECRIDEKDQACFSFYCDNQKTVALLWNHLFGIASYVEFPGPHQANKP